MWACVPACKACKDAGRCTKPPVQRPAALRRRAPWTPNDEQRIELPCGCEAIPWPVFHTLGDSFDTVICDNHGQQKLTKGWRKRARTRAHKLWLENFQRIPSQYGYQVVPRDRLL